MVTKENLIAMISDKTYFSSAAVRTILEGMAEVVMREVSSGNKVKLPEIGTIEPKRRAARTGRNPRTNKPVSIPERVLPTFKPSREFKNMMR